MADILIDALIDTVKLLPFLFLTYLAMEYLEHKTSRKVLIWVQKAGNYGPVIGSLLGAVPQCGFSAMASSLYAGRVISIGTLVAIYLSTSDEMLPMLISERAPIKTILTIIAGKIVIALLWGFLCDYVIFRNENAHEHIHIHSMCEQEHCNCDKGILSSALKHTVQITVFIFLVSVALGALISLAGEEGLAEFVLNNRVAGPFITALIGLIPNCAASVIITQLFLEGAIGVGPMMAGLLTGAGVGWLVLARASNDVKRTAKVVITMYVIGVICGLILGFFF